MIPPNNMEIFTMIIGGIMIYAWVHSVVVIFKKIENLTTYEQVLLWVGLVAGLLFIIGSID